MKSIVKEIFIILLLCIALCLVFGVIFYDYIPNNKVVPSTDETEYNVGKKRFRLDNKRTRQKL